MRIILLIIFVFYGAVANSQSEFSLSGRLIDAISRQPIPAATIGILLQKDSSVVKETVADNHGNFYINFLSAKEYVLIIRSRGYATLRMPLPATKPQQRLQLGDLPIEKEYINLSTVVVSAQTAIRVNGDTTTFNMEAFKTRPGSTLEDALKILPGLHVQNDGTVKAMGETVQKVYVDGKEFFGNDPKIATKNITADMVDQVQLFDDMSEHAKFTKLDDGSRSKTLNIKLKKDKKKGQFGKAIAGTGTKDRNEGYLSYNRFSDESKIALVASMNNTNKQAYQFSSASTTGTNISFGNGGPANTLSGGGMTTGGISSTKSGALNYSDKWGSRVDFRSSYHYADADQRSNQNNFRHQSFLSDSIATTNTLVNNYIKNQNHRLSTRIEFAIDSMQSILYIADFTLQSTRGRSYDSSFVTADGGDPYTAMISKSNTSQDRQSLNHSGELSYRRKFRKPGQTLIVAWKRGSANQKADNIFHNIVDYYSQTRAVTDHLNQDQKNLHDIRSANNSLTASYTLPAGKNKLFELNYTYSSNNNEAEKKAFEYNLQTGAYDKISLLQTSNFENTYTSTRLGSNFRLVKQKYNYQLGASVQWTESENSSFQASTGKDTISRRRFINFFPSLAFYYHFTRTSNLRFSFRGRTNTPSVLQLQEVYDASNPLQIKTGNPYLKPEFNSSIDLSYNHFNPRSLLFLNSNMTINTSSNKIVSSIDTAGSATLLIKPQNMNGSYNGSAMITSGMKLKKLKGAAVSSTTSGFINREASLLFKQKNFTTIFMLDQTVSFNYTGTKFRSSFAGSLVYTGFRLNLEQSSNNSYLKTAWSMDINYHFNNSFFLTSDVQHFKYSGRSTGYNDDILLWNIAAAKHFLKDKNAEIKITVYDILKENKGIHRLTGPNYYEDIRSTVMTRFILLSMTYNLKHQANKKQKDAGAKRAEERMIYFTN